MADDVTPPDPENSSTSNADVAPAVESSKKDKTPTPPQRIFLISYPKVVFLYPTFLAAVVAGIYMAIAQATPEDPRHDTQILAMIFLGILTVNFVVLSFDFPRGTSLTLFFFGAAVAMGLFMLFRFNPNLIPSLTNFVQLFRPWANAQFYFMFAGVLGVIYIFVAISVQFDYWEVRPNELLHHHGILSDLERIPAPGVKIEKEINDVFEYILLRSGRLVIKPNDSPRDIVLDNVFFINRKEEELTKMLGALQVQVRTH